MSVQIARQSCIRCGVCIDECPVAAICYDKDNVPVVIEEDCTDCGACATVCCSEAITV